VVPVFRNVAAILVLASLSALSQTPPSTDRPPEVSMQPWNPYRAKAVNSVDDRNTSRLYDLMRGGNVYLSLADAIALAIENNLDVQMTRYQLPIADTDVLRAKGGGALRGITTATTELPTGVGGPSSPLLTTPASGTTPATAVPTNLFDLSLVTSGSTTQAISSQSPLPSASGPPIPQYDPLLTGNLMWAHQTTLETDTLTTGHTAFVANSATAGLNLQQGFSTGTQYTLGYNSTYQSSNSLRDNYNPYSMGTLGLTVTQPLLRGFGIGVNRRFITIAKNDRTISDLNFRQQIINVIYGISVLYYDLIGLADDVHVKQENLRSAQELHKNTEASVERGTLPNVELTRADAEVAGAQQDLENSEGLLQEEELVVKNVLTRKGGREPAVRMARLIPTETLSVPDQEQILEVTELLPKAMAQRPDLLQSQLELENLRIALKGTKNALLPEIDLVATVQNNGLAGTANPLYQSATGTTAQQNPVSPEFLGGYGSMLSQMFSRSNPTYEIGLQLNLPIRNRVAQADLARDELQLRTSETQYLKLENQAELELEDAIIGLRRSRVAYQAAVRARVLQEQSLELERARLDAGLSTPFFVIQYQSYVAQARSTEVVARGNYFKAKAAMDRVVGASLETNGISFEDAYKGQLPRSTAPPR
jgi:outer membrane protein